MGKEFTKDVELELCAKFAGLVESAVVGAPFVIGAIEFLEEFYSKLSLFVASGTPDDELKRIANKRDIDKYFIALYGSPATKSSIVNDIVLTHNLKRSKVLMIGDAMTDYLAAKQARIDFVWRISDPDMIPPPHTQIIKDLAGLEDLILA